MTLWSLIRESKQYLANLCLDLKYRFKPIICLIFLSSRFRQLMKLQPKTWHGANCRSKVIQVQWSSVNSQKLLFSLLTKFNSTRIYLEMRTETKELVNRFSRKLFCSAIYPKVTHKMMQNEVLIKNLKSLKSICLLCLVYLLETSS
jgi:hypothetical protein